MSLEFSLQNHIASVVIASVYILFGIFFGILTLLRPEMEVMDNDDGN